MAEKHSIGHAGASPESPQLFREFLDRVTASAPTVEQRRDAWADEVWLQMSSNDRFALATLWTNHQRAR